MSKRYINNANKYKQLKAHAFKVKERSRTWGQKKFTPEPVVAEDPTPWKHVKNDILDNEQEQRSSERFNLDSEQAKEVMKQREQNHRRNVIEARRNETVEWETFDDGSVVALPSKSKEQEGNSWIDPKNMDFKQRNYIRQKLTRSIMKVQTRGYLEEAINDMQRNKVVKTNKGKNKAKKV
ncbi:hypothetical protein KR222_003753 [Zaprionus bogoriensis]|nr:hypothetical protein KR222_003753 [Zaprionus bogoriensis]